MNTNIFMMMVFGLSMVLLIFIIMGCLFEIYSNVDPPKLIT